MVIIETWFSYLQFFFLVFVCVRKTVTHCFKWISKTVFLHKTKCLVDGCAYVGVFVDSRQGDWDLTELKSVAARGSWSALLPDSNITQAGAFLREAWEPKVDLCVTLSASLLGWCQCCDGAAAGGESWPGQNRVQLNTRRNRSVCWCYSDDNYFAEIQFRSF